MPKKKKKESPNGGYLVHSGMADASSAIPIGHDRFLVVGDEKSTFQLFRNDESGLYMDEVQFSQYINIESKKLEADIEGSATIGDVTYWIGSHSRDSQGGIAYSRHQLFATIIKDKGDHVFVRQVGSSYTGLLNDLILQTDFRKLTKEDLSPDPDEKLSAKSKGAVSIEGLSAYKSSLMIGFRNPIPKGKAVVVPLLNPLEVVLYGGHAEFGDFIFLDLGDHGIRSMDYWPERNVFVIVAGAYDTQHDFAYYTWSGKAKDAPEKLKVSGVDDLNPEALVFYEGKKNMMQIISDDGGAIKKKKVPKEEKFFRSAWVKF